MDLEALAALAGSTALAGSSQGAVGPQERPGSASAQGGRNSRTGSGTRFSGAPLWRFTLRRDEHRRLLEDDSKPATVPDGFEPQSDGWHWNPKYRIFWRSSTRKFYRYNEITKAYTEIAEEPSVEKELRLIADASSVHRHERAREDRHVIVRDLGKAAQALKMPIDHLPRPLALFAVYDGHRPTPVGAIDAASPAAGSGHDEGGEEQPPPTCAEYCAKHFHLKLLSRLADFKGPWDDLQIATALRESCDEVDADFLARPGQPSDGCSATLVLLTGRRLFVAGVGDSVGFLAEDAEPGGFKVSRLTVNHSPALPGEMGRICAAGGAVVHAGGRHVVQALPSEGVPGGALHISRAFGDRALKGSPPAPPAAAAAAAATTPAAGPPEPPPRPPLVVATPDVVVRVLDQRHHALVIGCSEIGALPEAAVAGVLWKRRGKPRVACGNLLQLAQANGASGSLTTMCVCLDWVSPEAPAPPPAEPAPKRQKVDPNALAKASQVRCRQILVRHKDCKEPIDKVRNNKPVTRTVAEAERILLEAIEAIEGNTERSIFTQRCKAVSECSTCLKGGEMAGDLGWLSRGQAHPAVEAAAFALPVGHISDIVESDEGVHVLWRIA